MAILRPGLMAWAEPAIGLRPPRPHPCIIVRAYPTGAVQVAYISHSRDLFRHAVAVVPTLTPSAFRPLGPLTDARGWLGLTQSNGDPATVMAVPLGNDRLQTGGASFLLSRCFQLPDPEWQAMRAAIHAAME